MASPVADGPGGAVSLGRADGVARTWPAYTRSERVADGTVHLLGVLAVLAGSCFLVRASLDDPGWRPTAAILPYLLGLTASFACSATYNMAPPGRLKDALRRFDHAAIFLLIAGTYTPVTLLSLGFAWNAFLLTLVWAGALSGMLLKLLAPGRHERLGLVLYLGLGWVGLLAFPALAAALSRPALCFLVAGGLAYTVGVPFHLARRLPFHNAVWHALVALGAALHFATVTLLLQRAG